MLTRIRALLPRGIYSRSTLILLLPVIGVQFIVSVVFIQRHFEDVTRQMSINVAYDLGYVFTQANATTSDADLAALGRAFNMDIAPATVPVTSARGRWDLSGRVIDRELRGALPQITAIDLCDGLDPCTPRFLTIGANTNAGPVAIRLQRARISASNPHQLLVIMGVLGTILTLISFLYLRNQLKPIARLAHAATAYGRGQIIPYRIRGSTEVRAAGAAFLDMRARIERQAQARRLMLSGISHDLRTPLTRMQLALSMMDPKDAAPLQQDVDDMRQLVDTFLDYSRDETEETMSPVDVTALIEQTVGAATRTDHPVQIGSMAHVARPLHLRALAMRRALDNLISNGLRYGASVTVHLELTDRAIRFIVDDDGPGIPADQRDTAMRPFTRLDAARNQNRGTGVGLGLAIVSDVARAHGGRLSLETSPEGGLRAIMTIPR